MIKDLKYYICPYKRKAEGELTQKGKSSMTTRASCVIGPQPEVETASGSPLQTPDGVGEHSPADTLI